MSNSHISRVPVDRFTAGHYAAGVLMNLGRIPLGWSLVLATVYELVENPAKDYAPNWFPHSGHETTANAIVDILALAAGWLTVEYVVKPLDGG